MDPTQMNQGYRRLFWGAFFMFFFSSSSDGNALPGLPGIIGLGCCLSGTGLIYRQSKCRWFKGAWIICIIGICLWAGKFVLIGFYNTEVAWPPAISWTMRFVSLPVGAVVIMGIFLSVLAGAKELLEDFEHKYFKWCSAVFPFFIAITAVLRMFAAIMGGIVMNLFAAFYLVVLIGTMWMMAVLRRQHPHIGG